jgi:hypothetical protein
MQRLIIAVLRAALLPAAIMIVGKLLGLIIGNIMFGLDMYIANDIQGLFTVQLFFTDARETFIANSFSNLCMNLSLFIGFIIFYTRYSLYQTSSSNPRTLVKLVKLNLLGWITSNKGGVIEATIWAIFLWSANVIAIIQTLNSSSNIWVGTACAIILVFSFWGIVSLFEKDIQQALPKERILY